MSKLILHCGLHKTGSSSIQITLNSIRNILAKRGIYYPQFTKDGTANHSVPMHILFSNTPFSHHIIKREFDGNKEELEEYKKQLQDHFSSEISSNKKMDFLVSGEDISLLKKDELEKVRLFFENMSNIEEFKVIVYVRNPLKWSTSNAQELVKHGLFTLQQILGMKYLQNAKQRINKLVSVFGENNVEVVSFDSILSEGGDVVVDFLARIEVSDPTIESKRTNETLSIEKALAFNTAKIFDPEGKVDFIGYLNGKITNQGSPLTFPNFYLERIKKESEADLIYLKDKFEFDYNTSIESFAPVVNYDLLEKNLSIVKEYLEIIYKKPFDLPSMLRDLSNSIQGYSAKLAASIMVFAYNLRNGPLITTHLNRHINEGNAFGFFSDNKFITVELPQRSTRAWPKGFNSFLSDPETFLHAQGIKLDYELYQDGKKIFPSHKMLANALYTGALSFPSPLSGKLLRSSTFIAPNIFKFFDTETNDHFYAAFLSELNSHSSTSAINVISPTNNFIVHIDFDDQDKFYRVSLITEPLLKGLFNHVATQGEGIEVSTESKPTILATRGLFHIGHTLWNSLSTYDDLLSTDKIKENALKVAVVDNFYMSAKETSEFFGLKTEEHFSSDADLIKTCREKGILPIFLSHDHISSELTRKLSSKLMSNLGMNYGRWHGKKVVILSIRSGDRSCDNQGQLYSLLIETLSKKYSDLVFVIDGVNDLTKISNSKAAAVNRILSTVNDENTTAKSIIKSKKLGVKAISLIGKPIEESLYWANRASVVVSPWGAAMVKYRWLTEKPVFVFGSEYVMSDKHLHRDLYEDPRFKEITQKTKCAYYSGPSIMHGENRNASYTIDQDVFLAEATSFIEKGLLNEL